MVQQKSEDGCTTHPRLQDSPSPTSLTRYNKTHPRLQVSPSPTSLTRYNKRLTIEKETDFFKNYIKAERLTEEIDQLEEKADFLKSYVKDDRFKKEPII